MKKRIFHPFLISLGATITVAATTSYALMAPGKGSRDYTSQSIPPIVESKTTTQEFLGETAVQVLPEQMQEPHEQLTSVEYIIKPGDSISGIFAKHNLSHTDLKNILNHTDLGKAFIKIAANKQLIIKTDPTGTLKQLIYQKDKLDSLVATRSDNNEFAVEAVQKPVETKIVSAQTTIDSSLFVDGKKQGLSDKVIMQLVDIFAWDIDFALNIKTGDQITVLYEKFFIEDQEVDTGKIIAVEFINQGKPHIAVMYEDEIGNTGYYSPEGKRMQKAFLRTPVDFARISSHFNLKRKHPVLNRIRAHKGVDYAAKTGTPVKSTANGKVIFKGWKGGYGRVIMLQHAKNYSTVYAHLSKFKSKLNKGDTVTQGEVIGYVGQSGLASGPHLHYELRVNGIHKNPLKVHLPETQPLDPKRMDDFRNKTQPLLAQLSEIKAVQLAQNDI